MYKLFFFALMIFAALPSRAATGSQLNIWCNGSSPAYTSMCTGYILGSAEALTTMNNIDSSISPDATQAKGFCPPYGKLTPDDVVDVVKKYLADNPQNRGEPASYLVLVAMSRAFPCK